MRAALRSGSFIKFPTSQFPCLYDYHHKFRRDWQIINGILLGEQGTFSAVSRLPLDGFSLNSIFCNFHAGATNRVSLLAIGL